MPDSNGAGSIPLRLDLTAAGFPNQWIQMDDIGTKSPQQFEALQNGAAGQDDVEGARVFLGATIKDWYVLDPTTGTALPPPSSTGWEVKQLPMRVNKLIQENIAAQMEEVLPKATSRSA